MPTAAAIHPDFIDLAPKVDYVEQIMLCNASRGKGGAARDIIFYASLKNPPSPQTRVRQIKDRVKTNIIFFQLKQPQQSTMTSLIDFLLCDVPYEPTRSQLKAPKTLKSNL